MGLLGTKALITSTTFWGIIIAGISPVLRVFGFDISKELTDLYQAIIQVIGLVIALIGRIKAKQTIGGFISDGTIKA